MLDLDENCRFGDFLIEPSANTLIKGDESAQISPRVMDVLMYLVVHHDRVVSADELLDQFWAGRVVEESTIHRHINQVRTALGDSARDPRYIKTVSKRGYQAIAAVVRDKKPPGRDHPVQAGDTLVDAPDNSYVFVCYSHDDAATVLREIDWLASNGIDTWYDKGISAGTNWRSEVGGSLLGASKVLFFVSKRSVESEHCNREINLALDEGIQIVPVYLEDAELTPDLKVGIARLQALRLDDPDYRQKLLSALSASPLQGPSPHLGKAKPRWAVPILIGVVVVGLLLTVPFARHIWFSVEEEAAPAPPSLEAVKTIAVLPFVSLSSEAEAGYFAQGLTESILDELARDAVLKVASRTETFKLASEDLSLSALAERLDVAYVIEGSVQKMGDDVRIVAQLVRASDGFHVWSKTYLRSNADGFEMQQEVARNVAHVAEQHLLLDVEREHPELFDIYDGVDPDARELFLQAHEVFLNVVNGEPGDLVYAMQLIERAVQIDPDFAQAHWELAWNHMRRINPEIPVAQARFLAHEAIDNYRRLRPDDLSASLLLAQIHIQLDLDYASAEAVIRQGIEKEPTWTWWRAFMANVAYREGRQDEGVRYIKMEAGSDFSTDRPLFLSAYANALRIAGEFEASLSTSEEALSLVERGAARAELLLIRARTLLDMGRVSDARALVEEAWGEGGAEIPHAFGRLYVELGEPERARDILENVDPAFGNRGDLISGYIGLGNPAKALALIREGIEDHDRSVLDDIRGERYWDPLRDDPRFLDLLAFLRSKETHTAAFMVDVDQSGSSR